MPYFQIKQFLQAFILVSILAPCSLEASENISLSDALNQGRKVAIFNVNDTFTDADSLQSFLDSLLIGSKYGHQITQYFVSDDEMKAPQCSQIQKSIEDKTILAEERASSIRDHFLKAPLNKEQNHGYRIQDTAAVLFPIADKLGQAIHLIEGEVSVNPTQNPYLGNFGAHYSGEEKAHINRIHKETGSAAVIAAIRTQIKEGKLIYILNGGSFRLLSDIQQQASELMPYISVSVMGFRQPMNFAPFNDPTRKWRPSWNEGIDWESTSKFMAFSSQPSNPTWRCLRIIDINTVEYGMVCNGSMYPTYEQHLEPYKHLLNNTVIKNLLDTENRHELWSTFKTRFADSAMVFDAFGRAQIPMATGQLLESPADYNVRVTLDAGFKAQYPLIQGEHPFSHPRVPQGDEFQNQISRVIIFRDELKKAHQDANSLIPQ